MEWSFGQDRMLSTIELINKPRKKNIYYYFCCCFPSDKCKKYV